MVFNWNWKRTIRRKPVEDDTPSLPEPVTEPATVSETLGATYFGTEALDHLIEYRPLYWAWTQAMIEFPVLENEMTFTPHAAWRRMDGSDVPVRRLRCRVPGGILQLSDLPLSRIREDGDRQLAVLLHFDQPRMESILYRLYQEYNGRRMDPSYATRYLERMISDHTRALYTQPVERLAQAINHATTDDPSFWEEWLHVDAN